jgi:hypothetical protein
MLVDGLFCKFYELSHLLCAMELLMSLIAFAQSAIVFMTLSAWVMVGGVMFLWLKLIVSETRSLLVAFMWHLCVG